MTPPDVLVLAVVPGTIHARWADTSRSVPATAAALGDGWVFGVAAHDIPGFVDITTVVAEPAMPHGPDPGVLLTGLVRYAAAAAGAPPDAGTALVVYPTWWNERRRELMYTAARQVAHNALLIPTAVAARRAIYREGAERCVVLEFSERGVTAVAVSGGTPGSDPVVERLARDRAIDVHDPGAPASLGVPTPLGAVIAAVADPSGPDMVIVTGEPGEPAGAQAFARIGESIGARIPVVPVAATEMLAAVVSDSATEPDPPDIASTVPWLQEARASVSEPAPTARYGRIAAGLLAVVVLAALGAVLLSTGGPASPRTTVSGTGVLVADADEGSAAPPGPESVLPPPRSARFDIGPVHLDLPEYWRVRAPEVPGSGRVELLPATGGDRRIVVVYSTLADGMDERAVAAVLDARAAERGPVIRNLDADTTFGDRKVIAYTEVPDEFSVVRWSVVVFPGLQVAVGCQFLDGEWAGIRGECEQAVHTLEGG